MKLITDVFYFDNLKVISESKAEGTMTLEGTFQRAEQPNSNKRVYPKTVLSEQVTRLQDLIESRRLCGELDHPQNETVKLSNASHLITKLWMEGNEVFGRAELLNTPAGKVAQTLVNDGVSVGISSRGLGTLSEDASTEGYKTVNADYKLVTFDLVADPSTKGAFPTLSESVEYINDTSRQALKERTYITLLKQQINDRFGDKKMNEETRAEVEARIKGAKPGTIPPKEAAAMRGSASGRPKKVKGTEAAKRSGKAVGRGMAKVISRSIPGSGPIRSHTEYDPDQVLQVLENNIRRFIAENDDHVAAAQFIVDHKQDILEGLFNWISKGRTQKTLARAQAKRSPDAQAAHSGRVQAKRSARVASKGKARQRKLQRRADTRDVIKGKLVDAPIHHAKSVGHKIKGKFAGAVAKVKGGIAGAKERVASAVAKSAEKSRAGEAAARETQIKSGGRAGTETGKARKRSGGADIGATADAQVGATGSQRKGAGTGQKRGKTFREIARNVRAREAAPKAKKPVKSNPAGAMVQGKLPFNSSHDWEVESAYQLHRLHENLKRFND